jgi:hypothetical protein
VPMFSCVLEHDSQPSKLIADYCVEGEQRWYYLSHFHYQCRQTTAEALRILWGVGTVCCADLVHFLSLGHGL